jgi:hypothetical protein
VAADIAASGGQCDIMHYDALSPACEQLSKLEAIDCCYYFATPKIFLRKSALYEPERLRNFPSFYADGFFEPCSALASRGSGKIAVFYPRVDGSDRRRAQQHRGIRDGEGRRRDPGKSPQSIHVQRHPGFVPPAPDPHRPDRNRRRRQRTTRWTSCSPLYMRCRRSEPASPG